MSVIGNHVEKRHRRILDLYGLEISHREAS